MKQPCCRTLLATLRADVLTLSDLQNTLQTDTNALYTAIAALEAAEASGIGIPAAQTAVVEAAASVSTDTDAVAAQQAVVTADQAAYAGCKKKGGPS
jgi:hypothetical protein